MKLTLFLILSDDDDAKNPGTRILIRKGFIAELNLMHNTRSIDMIGNVILKNIIVEEKDKKLQTHHHCRRHHHNHYGLWKAKRFQISRSIYGTHHLPQFTQQNQSTVAGEQIFLLIPLKLILSHKAIMHQDSFCGPLWPFTIYDEMKN